LNQAEGRGWRRLRVWGFFFGAANRLPQGALHGRCGRFLVFPTSDPAADLAKLLLKL